MATSGGLFRNGEHRPGILTRLEDIIETLRGLRSGAMTIQGAPLRPSSASGTTSGRAASRII